MNVQGRSRAVWWRIITQGLGIGLASWLVTGSAIAAVTTKPTPPESSETIYKELELVGDALHLVESDYVEQPAAKQLIYGALKGMLATLDPYSQFLDPDSYNELKVDTEGEFGGLGIEITLKDELLTIISPIDDTPAYKAGLQAGDRIIKIDGELTRGITLLEAVKKLRGKPNTKVTLTLLHEGDTALKDVTLERAIIKIQSVKEGKLLDAHIGYIRISDFREQTHKDLQHGLEQLKSQGMESLILDLRNNPGGLLDEAVSVSELFLEREQLIVTTKGRLHNQNMEFHAKTDGLINGMPMVVLINEGSASASEIVAGALQDHHRGIILGTRSHGKASVQTIFPLRDGSALRLTTSKYFTPAGRSIHGHGIDPDVEVKLEHLVPEDKAKGENAKDLFERIESGEKPVDAEAAKKSPLDNQVARAVDLLKGIKVYQSKGKPTS